MFTDHKAELREAVSRSQHEPTADDLARKSDAELLARLHASRARTMQGQEKSPAGLTWEVLYERT